MSTVIPNSSYRNQVALGTFRRDVLQGLSESPKRLSCKYFYDHYGSQLFDTICDLEEYYLTRSETSIMKRHASEIAARIGERTLLIEFGSGSSMKTRYLLHALDDPAAYVPVDVSRAHLLSTAHRLRRDYPHIEILPLCADFTDDLELPIHRRPSHATVYFPGSTIGNFEQRQAIKLLKHIANLCGARGKLLIGIDLQKDPAIIEPAYNDAAGVTAQFNLNVLRRINRELLGDFDLASFSHHAFYDSDYTRVDIRLISERRQQAHIGGVRFCFEPGEAINTEYSHKYTIEGFTALARHAGLALRQYWMDRNGYFAVLLFERSAESIEKITFPGYRDESR